MRRQVVWMLPVGLLVLAGALGCSSESKPVDGPPDVQPAAGRVESGPARDAMRADLSPQEVVAEIERLGGQVVLDETSPEKPVVAVVLNSTPVTDAHLGYLKRLPCLKGLFLGRTRVSDVGLLHVKQLSGLEELSLEETQVTGAGLGHLEDLTSLHTLRLTGTRVDDTGLEHL